VLFFILRDIERWLHQHIFKVGWLLTRNYETTTILYYTIFLPGVLLHEVVYWLMAGVMNVRADRSIQWPEKQEIGDLQLNFIRLAPKAHPIKRAIIATTPLFVGLMAIWLIAVNIFQLETVIATAGSGQLYEVANAISVLTSAPDFWLWFYISFTIANTMFPSIPKDMSGWWQVAGAIGVIITVFVILGIGQSFLANITLTLTQLLNTLSLTLILTLLINFVMVMVLGFIEYSVERVTGHSATFQKGKMITMTREEAIELKQEEQRKRLAARTASTRRKIATELTSVYSLELPVPGPPSQEPVTKGVAAVIGMDADEPRPSITEDIDEDEVVETTATDSARQRRLRLFPEPSDKPSERSEVPESSDGRLLPESTKSDADESKDEEKPKPTFNIQSVAPPTQTDQETVNESISEEIKDTEVTEETDVEAPSIADEEDATDAETPSIADEEEAIVASQSVSPNIVDSPDTDKSTSNENDLDDVEATAHDTQATEDKPDIIEEQESSVTPVLSDKDTEQTDEDEQSEIESVATATPAWRSKLTMPSQSEDEDEKIEETSEAQEEVSIELEDVEDNSGTDSYNEVEDDDESISAFSRPFARPFDISNTDGDEDEDEQLEKTQKPSMSSATFPRPFVPRDISDDDQDDEDEDEQLTTRLPKASNPFAKLDQPVSKPTSNWRDKLFDTEKQSDDEDKEKSDEPAQQDLFASLTKPKANETQSSPSNWRDKLGSLDTDEDENDDDDEQLGNRPPRRSSMFDTLNQLSDNKPKSATTNWRDKLGSLNTDNEESDDDDEQLGNRPPQRSSMFDTLNQLSDDKPKSTATNWRDKLSSLDTDNDENEDDEQLGSRSSRRSSIFDTLNQLSDDKPKSTATNWRDRLSNLDTDDDENGDDNEQLRSNRVTRSGLGQTNTNKPRSNVLGRGSQPVPKPSDKSKPKESGTSDWRSQLISDDEDDFDEDVIYEPLEDDIVYEDDTDDIDYDDDEDIYYDN